MCGVKADSGCVDRLKSSRSDAAEHTDCVNALVRIQQTRSGKREQFIVMHKSLRRSFPLLPTHQWQDVPKLTAVKSPLPALQNRPPALS